MRGNQEIKHSKITEFEHVKSKCLKIKVLYDLQLI